MSNVKLIAGGLAICALLTAGGCSKEVELHFYDQEALSVLEQYSPEYELDEQGRVVSLKLENPEVNDITMQNVKDLTELHTLSLYGSSITDKGLVNLTGLGRLHSLGLGQTAVSDKGLVHIAQIPNLQWVWIPETKITKRGVASLKKAKPGLNVFQ